MAGRARDAIVCLNDFESYARRAIDKVHLDFFEGGADEEETLRSNVEAFKRYKLIPRILKNVSTINLSTTILGSPIPFPVCLAPTGWHRLAHPDGEVATARAAQRMSVCYTLSFSSNCSIFEVAAAAPDGLKFFQLYNCRNRDVIVEIIRMAEQCDFRAFVVTLDVPVLGNRTRDLRNRFVHSLKEAGNRKVLRGSYQDEDFELDATVDWSYIRWIQSLTSLPLILKGIISAEDAQLAVGCGVAGILVSNHGGRQLDGIPATIDVLGDVVKAVAGRCEVYLDGGVRKGTDVLKALALGARAVFIGRPVIYALSYDGENGVFNMLQILKKELSISMALCGCSSIVDITKDLVRQQTQIFSRI